mgnify:CR=1 FL=1
MDSIKSFFDKMGSNFIVAAFIPSLAFVVVGMFAFDPILPPAIKIRLGGDFNPLSQAGLISLVITVLRLYAYKS